MCVPETRPHQPVTCGNAYHHGPGGAAGPGLRLLDLRAPRIAYTGAVRPRQYCGPPDRIWPDGKTCKAKAAEERRAVQGAGRDRKRSFRRRDIIRKTKNGLDAARARGRVGGRRPVVYDDKRAAILARRKRGESIRTIAAGVKVSVCVVHKTLVDTQLAAAQGNPR
ncbi:hypothetical protein AB0K21_39090 [Streptosporangium sp. NPDC049248]|uniref:hypothetical protein n=1 Tax=Streptosporangium sp. NPDC049248 TaxID=3155651 RepID=UPI00342D135B